MAFKIYTKTGDKGETGLFGGRRIAKDDLRIEAYGTIDELNAIVGMLADQIAEPERQQFLRVIQGDLFVLGSHLAKDPDKDLPLPALPAQRIQELEASIDGMEQDLPALKSFILPGGHPLVSTAHLARCVCRRAERRSVSLGRSETVDPVILMYLNRLSDYFFVLSRFIATQLNIQEIPWIPEST